MKRKVEEPKGRRSRASQNHDAPVRSDEGADVEKNGGINTLMPKKYAVDLVAGEAVVTLGDSAIHKVSNTTRVEKQHKMSLASR